MITRTLLQIITIKLKNRSSVITVEAVFRSEPHKTITILQDRFHITCRQSIFSIDMSKIEIGTFLRTNDTDGE